MRHPASPFTGDERVDMPLAAFVALQGKHQAAERLIESLRKLLLDVRAKALHGTPPACLPLIGAVASKGLAVIKQHQDTSL